MGKGHLHPEFRFHRMPISSTTSMPALQILACWAECVVADTFCHGPHPREPVFVVPCTRAASDEGHYQLGPGSGSSSRRHISQ
jgi:hypothetical protein